MKPKLMNLSFTWFFAYDEIKLICTKFQDKSRAKDINLKTQKELAMVWGKDIDKNHDMDLED